MLVTKEQSAALSFVNTAREDLVIAERKIEHAAEKLRVACARASATGVPLRRIAAHAGTSHATVKRWVDSVPSEVLDGSALVARARAGGYLTLSERREVERLTARPGARGRRVKRKRK